MQGPPESQYPILALHARAQQRAAAFAARGGCFIEAVEPIWKFARDSGLIEMLGSEAVEQIIFGAFNLSATSRRRH